MAEAYLTTKIGPGTTVANQIASTQVQIPGVGNNLLTLFSNLTLGPGQYFLTVSRGPADPANPGAGWTNTDDPTIALGTGVTNSGVYSTIYSTNPIPAAYAPASDFTLTDFTMKYTVTSSPLPEPASLLLLGCGVETVLLALKRRKSSRST